MTDETKLKRYDDLVDTVEELHDEGMLLRQAIKQTLDENGHLADGENCTLIVLKRALKTPNNQVQRDAACGASPAPTGCASNGTNNERTDK